MSVFAPLKSAVDHGLLDSDTEMYMTMDLDEVQFPLFEVKMYVLSAQLQMANYSVGLIV